jgi:hypothetical protein
MYFGTQPYSVAMRRYPTLDGSFYVGGLSVSADESTPLEMENLPNNRHIELSYSATSPHLPGRLGLIETPGGAPTQYLDPLGIMPVGSIIVYRHDPMTFAGSYASHTVSWPKPLIGNYGFVLEMSHSDWIPSIMREHHVVFNWTHVTGP